jgi:GT2 family glycosyltransferase
VGVPVTVLLCDNHPDYTAEAVTNVWHSQYLHVRHLRSRERCKSAALNVGIIAAQTKWLVFTDDDCLPTSSWLVEGIRFIKSDKYRIFGGRVTAAQPTSKLPKWLTPGKSGRIPGIGVFVNYDPLPASGQLGSKDTIPFGANLFAHRDVFARYGKYDEELWDLCKGWPLGVEDTEFGCRVRKAGEPVGYCRESVVVHPVNHDRGLIRLHLHRAFYEGWRQPLIFFDAKRPWFEPYQARLIIGHLLGALADSTKNDPAGALNHIVEMMRVIGAMQGRWSQAYKRWTVIQNNRSSKLSCVI